jgi:hypothetical protein
MNKKLFFVVFGMMLSACGLSAQERTTVLPVLRDTTARKQMPVGELRTEVVPVKDVANLRRGVAQPVAPQQCDTLHLPVLNTYNAQPMYYPSYTWGNFSDWSLHPGLNASFGASVMVGMGRHSYSGAGFAQNVSLMYAVPLNNRFSLAIGGYYSHLNWNGRDFNDGGISGVLGYHINDRFDAYVYGQKTLINPRIPRPLMGLGNTGDRIGASLQYKITPSATIGISVETYSDNRPDYFPHNINR